MEILTTKEACDLLKISYRSLIRYIQSGLSCAQYKKNGKLYFSKEDFLDWFWENHNPTPERLKLIRR